MSKIEEKKAIVTRVKALASYKNVSATATIDILDLPDVEVFANDIQLNSKDENTERFVLISSDPEMPTIKIRNNTKNSIRGRLKIEYTKISGGNTIRKWLNHYPEEQNEEIVTQTIIGEDEWMVDFGDHIRGGTATFEFVEEDNEWNEENIQSFIFYIRATNPSKCDVMTYIKNMSYKDNYWFFVLLTKHESGTHEGDEYRQFNVGTNYTTTENSHIALPNFGAPRGFGLYQLDNYGIKKISDFAQSIQDDINALGIGEIYIDINEKHWTAAFQFGGNQCSANVCSDQAVWNWKKNIDEAKELLDDKKQTIINKYTSWVNKANEWNGNYPNDLIEKHSDQTEGNITFSSIESYIGGIPNDVNNYFDDTTEDSATTKAFIDACLIRYFNGGYYHKLRQSGNQKPFWDLDRDSTQSGFYVEHVCEELDEDLDDY